MGLFVTEDGHFQGWLAAFLCCCAAVADDESPYEKERSRPSTRVGVCHEQPLPLSHLPSTPAGPTRTFTKGDEPVDPSPYRGSRPFDVHDQPPSLKPLDLGDSLPFSRWSYTGKQKNQSSHATRPSISTPYNFRRLDHTEPQRQSLVPLRLGPVVLRESPVPDTDIPAQVATQSRTRSDSTQNLLSEMAKSESYLLHRETPFQRCQQRSSGMWPLPPEPVHLDVQPTELPTDERPSQRPSLGSRSRSSGSLRRNGTERSASSTTSRPSSERQRPKKKRSFQSVRRTLGDDDEEVEKEIVELNTIVEERRADTARDGSLEHHVAAVAPSMQIHARSETLDAIGSALSRPVTSRGDHRPSLYSDNSPEWHTRRSISTTTRVSTRVSGWLSGVFPSASSTHLPSGEPFYKCQPNPRPLQRSYSESSVTTALTEMDSPSLTAASSPTSRGHSRSHTGESWMTPLTPAAMYAGHDDIGDGKLVYDHWHTAMTPTNQVGLAI